MIDLKKSIEQKAELLKSNAEQLLRIELMWYSPIEVNCQQLSSIEEFKKTGVLELFTQFKEYPFIYYFIVKNDIHSVDIINALHKYRLRKERTCPKIDKRRSLDSRYLYCGSVKKELHGRFIQHLGFGSPQTFSLQLFHWATKLGLVLDFHYALLDKENRNITELVESSLASQIMPLVGKIA